MHRAKWVIGSVMVSVVAVSVAAGAFVFHRAILSKPHAARAPHHDVVGRTMDSYLEFGDRWLRQTGVETLNLKTPDGLRLQGYFVPAPIPSHRLVILVHGYGVDARMMAPYGAFYRDWGFNVFLADDRGHGQSEGRYVGMGWLDRLDYLQWTELLVKRLGPDTQIVLHGVSMGGATVMMMSGEALPPQVKAIVEDAGYTSVADELDYQIGYSFHLPAFPLREIASLESRWRAGYSFEEASAVDAVKRSHTPLLFIHGGADTFNPTAMVYALARAAPGPKELLVVPGAMHAMALHDAPARYQQTVNQFLTRYINNR